MGHEPNLIHIYSASWGPTDDGKTVDGPRNATMRAIVKGVNEVRKNAVYHHLLLFLVLKFYSHFFKITLSIISKKNLAHKGQKVYRKL